MHRDVMGRPTCEQPYGGFVLWSSSKKTCVTMTGNEKPYPTSDFL